MLNSLSMQTLPSSVSTRKQTLEQRLSGIANVPVEITVLGLKKFTASAEGDQRDSFSKLKSFLSIGLTSWDLAYDPSCDFTCAYFTVEQISI